MPQDFRHSRSYTHLQTRRAAKQGAAMRTVLISLLVVLGILGAFAYSFWFISRSAPPTIVNRAQSQIRTPAEEAQANTTWNPNRPLGSNQQMPPPNSWAANFGKTLADPTGVDADEHLYPPGTAPIFMPDETDAAPAENVLVENDDGVIVERLRPSPVPLPPIQNLNDSPVGNLLNP